MCSGDNCEKKDTCYRFLAKPDSYQSYFTKPPLEKDGITCEYFWPMEVQSNVQKKKKSTRKGTKKK